MQSRREHFFRDSGETSPPVMTRAQYWMVGVSGIALMALTALCVWGARQYQVVAELGQQSKQYAALDTRFPVDPAAEDHPDPADWQAMVRVRRVLLNAIGPEEDQRVSALLSRKSIDDWHAIRLLLPSAPALRKAIKLHQDALRDANMSMIHFRRLLGATVHEALMRADLHEAGRNYRMVLQDLERLALNVPDQTDVLTVQSASDTLARAYGSLRPPEGILEQLQPMTRADALLDLLIVNPQWLPEWEGDMNKNITELPHAPKGGN